MPKAKSHPKSKSSLLNQARFRGPILGVIIAAVAVGGFYLVQLSHGASGVLSIQPVTTNAGLGTNVTVAVRLDTGPDAINAVEADLTYPTDKLQYESYDNTGTAFPLVAQVPPAGSNTGALQFARATNGGASPVTSTTALVVLVTFKAIGTGNANIGIATTSSALTSANSTNILIARNGGNVVITDVTAPSVPTGLRTTSSTISSNGLSWNSATDDVGVTGYKVFRGGTQVGTSTSTTYTDSGLTPSTGYNYTVAAVDAAGNTSAQSTAISATTLADTTAPSTPGTPSSTGSTINSISLTWSPATDNVGVTGYKVFRAGTQVSSLAANSFTDTGLKSGTSYSYTVSAFDAAGNASNPSGAANLTTLADTIAPSVPTNVAISTPGNGATTASLTWNTATDNIAVAGYKVFQNGTQIGTSQAASYTVTLPTTPGTYNYTVAAYDSTGNTSAQSTAAVYTSYIAADINRDGRVNITDLSLLLTAWGTTSTTADVNHDGTVNIVDLSRLLSSWTG